jgi:hypothetical protein
MNEYSISDYEIFNDAITTTNNLSDSVNSMQTTCNECKSVISDESIFMGPVAEGCINTFDGFDIQLTTVIENLGKISTYLQEVSSSYSSGDVEASNTVLDLTDEESSDTTDIISTSSVVSDTSSTESSTENSIVSDTASTDNTTTLTGSSTSDQIWNYLIDKGYSQTAAAGIMGNLQQESGLNSSNVQDNKGYSDEEYVAAIKNGTISRDEFIHDGRGFGIAQWTYSTRKAALYDTLGAENIDNLSAQLDFMDNEIGSSLKNTLNNSSSASSAATTFERVYENAGTPNMSARTSNANNFYSQYSD